MTRPQMEGARHGAPQLWLALGNTQERHGGRQARQTQPLTLLPQLQVFASGVVGSRGARAEELRGSVVKIGAEGEARAALLTRHLGLREARQERGFPRLREAGGL